MTPTATKQKTRIKLQPLADRVVLERDASEETTSGGIVLPENAKEKINRGKVVAVGDGKLDDNGKRVPMQVKPGNHVLFSKYAGDEFQFSDIEYFLIRESDILAVLN